MIPNECGCRLTGYQGTCTTPTSTRSCRGVLSPLDLPVIDLANFISYVLWSVWLVVFAILLLRRPAQCHRCAGASALQCQRAMTIMEPSTSRRHALLSWLI
jgi:hypothetical protein